MYSYIRVSLKDVRVNPKKIFQTSGAVQSADNMSYDKISTKSILSSNLC